MKGKIKILVTSESQSFIRISVSDTGIGIPEEKQKFVFRLFGKLEGNDTINPQGCGLGLGIANLLAIELGGSDISLVSTSGLGSTFTFKVYTSNNHYYENSPMPRSRTLSLDVPDELQVPLVVPKLMQSGSDLSKISKSPSILVVDDNDFNRLVMSKLLSTMDQRCEEAGSGLQALILIEKEAQRNHFFQLILMDLEMPEMDGMTAARRILDMKRRGQLPGYLRVVACSAYCSDEDKEECGRAGMDGYLEKPVSREALRHLLVNFSIINAEMSYC